MSMDAHDEALAGELERTWARPRGVLGWLSDVSHLAIGRRFIATAFSFFALGGLEALVMRLQLIGPDRGLLGPDLYNQVFSVHGNTMMFLFAVPVMEGMGIFLIPLVLGTRNLAFPRLAALAYYLYVMGGLLLYGGFALNIGPDAGWFSYVPLSGPEMSPGKRLDFWAQMITFTELSALASAVALIATILKQRAPGMSLARMPLFAWAMLVASLMILFAMPSVMLSSAMLALDRLVGTHFFNPSEGGDSLLWQHLFWFFGHPEVYIIFIPALGMVTSIVESHTQRPVFGYLAMVLALVATAFIGFGLWVHHMFATDLPQIGSAFFTASSMMIAIPTGVQIFCWIATLCSGRPRLSTPLLFVLGFIAVFVMGGLSGVMLASVPIDLQVHDTYFVVAHFHYVLIGGAVFPLLGALHHWSPKIAGVRLDERLGYASFALVFIGFNVTFFPMHVLGLQGMPRRVYTYAANDGFGALNQWSTAGAFVLGAGVLLFLVNVARSMLQRTPAQDDPWHGPSLEWATSSPPARYLFLRLPRVHSRHPLWTHPEEARAHGVIGLRNDVPQVLITTSVDARPDHKLILPGGSLSPFATALAIGVTVVACIFNPWGLIYGTVLSAVPLVAWFWPRARHRTLPELRS
jgi:cytochrome c oxidase subunit 1